MSELRFTEDHEWVLMEDDGVAVVGITDYAQDQLGELVFVELPEIGTEYSQGSDTAVIESVKAAGEIKAPVGGTVVVGAEEAVLTSAVLAPPGQRGPPVESPLNSSAGFAGDVLKWASGLEARRRSSFAAARLW